MPTYTVQQGDTLSHIARRKGTTVTALKEANPNVDPRRLQIGQNISLPYEGGGGQKQSAPPQQNGPSQQAKRGAPGGKRKLGGLTDMLSSVAQGLLNTRQTAAQGKKRLVRDLTDEGVEGTKENIKELWFDVLDESHEEYGRDSVKGDAYRHYESSRQTAQKYGPMTAATVGIQHELKNLSDFVQGKYEDDFGIGDLMAAIGQDMVNNLRGVFDGTTGREPASPSNLSQMDRTYKGR